MTCQTAMLEEVVSVGPRQTIGDALTLLKTKCIRWAPVVDADGRFLGHFAYSDVLAKLLPGPLSLDAQSLLGAHLRLDYMLDADSDVAKELHALLPVPIEDMMDGTTIVVRPTTPLWEGIRLLVLHGGPLPVVDEDSGKLLGLLSVQSATIALMKAYGVPTPDDSEGD